MMHPCPICLGKFHRRRTLIKHIQTVHQQLPHLPSSSSSDQGHIMDAGSGHPDSRPASQDLTSNSSTHFEEANNSIPFMPIGTDLFCPECKNPFASKCGLMKHLRSTRCRQESQAIINQIINDQLTCSRCFTIFGSIPVLKKHVEGIFCPIDSLYKYIFLFTILRLRAHSGKS